MFWPIIHLLSDSQQLECCLQMPRSPSSITAINNAQSSSAIASPEGLKAASQERAWNQQSSAEQSSVASPGTPENGMISFSAPSAP